jgi:hypothetical protein
LFPVRTENNFFRQKNSGNSFDKLPNFLHITKKKPFLEDWTIRTKNLTCSLIIYLHTYLSTFVNNLWGCQFNIQLASN